MLIAEEFVETHAKPETVWALWLDVENWKAWDPGVAWSRLSGEHKLGAAGELQPTKGPKSKFTITKLVDNSVFVDESKLPLARLSFQHELTLVNGRTRICHRVEVKGPLAFFFNVVIGTIIRKDLPTSVKNLARLAEANEAARG